MTEIEELRRQVTDLQATNTRIEDERRKYKAIASAARTILREALVEMPMLAMITREDPAMGVMYGRDAKDLAALFARITLLEADTWAGCAALARAFVEEAHGRRLPHLDDDDWVQGWRERFRKALDNR